MLTYDLTKRNSVPLYEYLYKCIKQDIFSGRLKYGDKLPSKREMAINNGIALVTVENAYEQLIIEGYVETKPRKGYFVCDVETQLITDSIYTEESGIHISKEKTLQKNNVIDFSSGVIQSDSFPYSTWSKLMRRVLSDRETDFAKPPEAAGVYELREAIANHLRDSRGFVVDVDRIIVGPGTEFLHSIILQLIGQNRTVAVEDPGYKKVERIYEGNGLKVIHIPVDKDGMVVDNLYGQGVGLVHVSPAHHFPTGSIMSASRRHRLISWAADNRAYIIEDDFDSEFRFRGRPLPTIAGLDSEHVIYMNTFTGTLAPSIRIAFMVLPRNLMREYDKRLSYLSGTVSTFEQLTLAAFISEGYFARHINRLRNKYRMLNERYLSAFTRSSLSKVASVDSSDAGWQFGIHIEADIDDGKFLEKLSQKGIYLRSIGEYCYDTSEQYKHRFVIRYVDIPEDELVAIFNEFI